MSTIAAYELELNTVTKSLEQSRATYLSLQKQYQEQCSMYIHTNELRLPLFFITILLFFSRLRKVPR